MRTFDLIISSAIACAMPTPEWELKAELQIGSRGRETYLLVD